jgi:glyoxylase-like metal-dependent hydrolase (beta-lactamase superfamily II)
MFWKAPAALRPGVLVLLCIAGSAAASAQVPHQRESELTAQLVKTGLFVISGGGCNSLVRFSANGFVLVDGKLPGNRDAIVELAKKLSYSDQPIRILINTDYREQHTGGNAAFLAAGTQIIAQENVKLSLIGYNPPGGKITPPTITYDHEYTIKIGGIEVQLMHFGNAHTSGDTVVYFPNLKVVDVGDLYAATPDPDFLAGGSLVGWGPALGEILKLDFDVVVPGSGPGVSRAGLEAYKVKIDTLVSRARELVMNGVGKDQLMAQLKTDDLGWKFNFTGEPLDRFYAELSRTR